MKLGRMYQVGYRKSYFVKVERDNEYIVIMLSQTALKAGRNCALQNPEDLPKQGLLIDWLT